MRCLAFSIALAIFFLMSANAQPSPSSADEVLKEASRQATKENKNVLVMFHASWCIWCHRMDSSINDASCKKFFDDNYVISHLTVDESKDKQNLENPSADDLRKKYHGDGQGIPFWLILDKEGNLLADSKIRAENAAPETGNNIGCPAREKEVDYFLKVLQQTSKLSEQQLEVIRERFRKNE
jgi:thioredoxin-related protein